MADAESRGKIGGGGKLGGRQGRRHRRGRHHPVGAQGPDRGRQQERRVRPTGEGNQHRTELGQPRGQVVEAAEQQVGRQPAAERGQVGQHDVGSGRAQLVRRTRASGYRDGQGTGRVRTDDVPDMVTHVDRDTVGTHGLGFRFGEPPALDRVRLDTDVGEARLRERSALSGDDNHPAAMVTHLGNHIDRARHRQRHRQRVDGVQLAVAGRHVRHPLGREPAGDLLLQRRPEAGGGHLAVDRHPGFSGQRDVGGGDAAPGVQQRHVQVESDDRTSRDRPDGLHSGCPRRSGSP